MTAPAKTTEIDTAALVAAVKAHAQEHYQAGWDVVVETMTDEDIAERIGKARTAKGAIAKVAEMVEVQTDRRIEVLAQSGEHDEEVAALVETSGGRRGRSKTGHPKADRVIADAKVAKAEEQATAINETKTAKTGPKAPAAKPPVTLPTGYAIRYENGAYNLAKKGEGAAADAPSWLVICTAHGTTTIAEKAKDGDALGRKAGRASWCTGCKS
jgi:hypothetical protein